MAKICITGASGYLGSHISPELIKLGHDLIRVDMVEPEKSYGEYRQADLRNEEQAKTSLAGSEIIIHCASIHPWKQYTNQQYLDMNVKGTWNLFQVASELKINRIILTSSIAASGYNPELNLCPVGEDYQKQDLNDIYSLTKLFQEQIARHFCAYRGLKVIALRPPNFTPKQHLQTGAALLSGCLLVTDIASAHVKAIDSWEKMKNSFEPFFITPMFPYSKDEEKLLSNEPKAIIDKYYPGVYDWFGQQGVKLHPVPTQYDNNKAKRLLNWQPEYTFSWWWNNKQRTAN